MSEPITLGYWNVQGVAHSIRLLLKVANADYKDRLYDENEKQIWFDEKPNIGLDFPNLPYLIDGETKLTQSLAILRYLGRKFNLSPESEDEKVRCEVLEMTLTDWLMEVIRIWALPKEESEEKKKTLEESMQVKLPLLEKYLKDGPYVLGEKLSYVDFLLYQYLDYQRRYIPGLLASSPILAGLIKNIESLEQVKAYLDSDEFKEVNFITGSSYNWGNRNVPNHLDVE